VCTVACETVVTPIIRLSSDTPGLGDGDTYPRRFVSASGGKQSYELSKRTSNKAVRVPEQFNM
jgi:hypothetical protein